MTLSLNIANMNFYAFVTSKRRWDRSFHRCAKSMMSQNMMFKPAQIYEIISVVISQSNSHT